jgi:hypothetical protein
MLEKVLLKIRPNSSWSIIDGKLNWLDTDQSEPTKDEIDSSIKLLNFEKQKQKLNQLRDGELNSLVIDNILVSENIVKTMSVKYNISLDDDTVSWIDINNQTIIFTKSEFGSLLKKATDKIEYIYFKYRKLKDDLQ